MERIKIMFLTFVLFLSSVGGMACWDDWDDDWDDWDDWGDDWCHYNDDDGSYWLNNVDVTPDDIGGDDDGSIWLDEVFVTYNVDDDDNGNDNNDDWGDDDRNDDDFGWFDEEEDYNDNDNGSHDNHQQTDNIDYTIPVELKETFEKLPEGVKNLLMENGVKIFYAPSYRSPDGGYASYNPKDNSITTSSLNDNVLLREAIHAAQNVIGSLDATSRSAEEFQEKVLGDFANYYNSMIIGVSVMGEGYTLDVGYEGHSGWLEFIIACFNNNGVMDRDYFKENIMDFFDIFQISHINNPGYSEPLEENFKWNWDYFLNLLGF